MTEWVARTLILERLAVGLRQDGGEARSRKATGRRTRRFVQDDVALDTAPAPPPGVATGVEDAALVHALSQLDPLQREALLLKYAEGLEYGEMSAMTGAGESALKMRVKRGSERLRALLGRSLDG